MCAGSTQRRTIDTRLFRQLTPASDMDLSEKNYRHIITLEDKFKYEAVCYLGHRPFTIFPVRSDKSALLGKYQKGYRPMSIARSIAHEIIVLDLLYQNTSQS